MSENGNGKSLYQLIGFIVILFSLVMGVRSFTEPMNQRISTLDNEIKELKQEMKDIENRPTRGAAERLSAIDVKFIETETQIRLGKELQAVKDEFFNSEIKDLRQEIKEVKLKK